MNKQCLGCPRDISHMAGQAKYCSVRCRFWSHRKNKSRNCLECGTDLFSLRDKEKFCSDKCAQAHREKLTIMPRTSEVKKEKPCKWCTGAEEGFCSVKHEKQYNILRVSIDSELARSKPEPTEAQLRGYKKIAGTLINSETFNR